jgi:phosphate transport system permease protein
MKKNESTTRSAASRRLHAMDTAAEFVVTSGGFLVLTAVLGICFYLLWVVLPLFERGTLGEETLGKTSRIDSPEWIMVDPYQHAAALVDTDLDANVIMLETGEQIAAIDSSEGFEGEITSSSFARGGEFVAVGYADGSVRLGSFDYSNRLRTPPEGAVVGQVIAEDQGYLEIIEEGRGRVVQLALELGDPIEMEAGDGAVVRLDYRRDPTGKKVLAVLREDGTVLVSTVRTIRPLGGGAPTTRLSTKSFAFDRPDGLGKPDWMHVTADSDHVLMIWKNGRCDRYARLDDNSFVLAETAQVATDRAEISSINMLLGSLSLLVGQSDGRMGVFHVADDVHRTYADERRLVRAHLIQNEDSPIVSMKPSTRDRSVLILHANGVQELRHITSEKLVAKIKSDHADPVAATITPKNDGIMSISSDGSYELHEIEPGYPEFSVKALFGRVFYEGTEEPEYIYQSSSGDDASEIKLSLMPLIFGTLKATVFAMIFAIPIGVLAAIYSSEFVSKRVRRKVKPVVELMASLPSVVLGFVAAMVVAPFIAEYIDSFVIGLVLVPMSILLAAHIWQLIPLSIRLRTRSGQHMTLVAVSAVAGIGISLFVGPAMVRSWFEPDDFDAAVLAGSLEPVPESELPAWADDAAYNTKTQRRLRNQELVSYDGEIYRAIEGVDNSEMVSTLGLEQGSLRRWLNGEYGVAWPGWFVVFFPIACILVWLTHAILVRRRIDLWISQHEAHVGSIVVLSKFVLLTGLGFLLAYIGAVTAQSLGYDPRDSIFGSFSPRNTLVVAIIMGFAVIPIIYTISEDALQAVPMTLRTASLGSGATPWQTATRVVLPVAASGIFSACMIGFGRAVGETMIVLMATGNTPEMNWNIFAGFRTLAANIAVELPEAPKDETHYRVLFLCGLVLFVMTFVINTLAELVRRVVRARNAGL